MNNIAPFIAPLIALLVIFRRGNTPRRVKPGRLWIYPLLLAFLIVPPLLQGGVPAPLTALYYAVGLAAGLALGWFTTQHVELTLDDATGTIMSKPTTFGTLLTAAVFILRFGIDYLVNGGPKGGHPPIQMQAHHASNLLWFANAALLFAAGRILAQAAHMWIRTSAMIAAHKASGISAPPPS